MTKSSDGIPVNTIALILLATAVLVGCASTRVQPGHADEADADLYAWVDEQLAPYLIDQLGRQPRFKEEPVLLVSMNGSDIRPDIDTLTRNVRARLMDRLLLTPGVSLYWRPTFQPWEHHRRNHRLRCDTASSARYFVGIDIATTSTDRYRASVRALDVSTAAWVSGFGKIWEGRLTHSQQQALAERRADEYLRGLRVLPFLDGETDLLAAYLAQNLSCLLREQGATDHRILVEPRVQEHPELQKVLNLITHNLARNQTAQISEHAEDAELVLGGSLNPIDGSLHQLWVRVRARTPDSDLTGVDTGAYIHLNPSAPDRIAVDPTGPKPALPTSQSARMAVLSKLRALKASNAGGCVGPGHEPLFPNDAVGRDECFLVEFDLYQPAHVVVLNHRVDGVLTRLPQDGCPSEADHVRRWVPRRRVRIVKQDGDGFRWAGRSGIESVYAIAVTDDDVARQLDRHMNDLPDGCGLHPGDSAGAEHFRAWLAQLDRLITRSDGHVDWQAIRVRHSEP